MLKITPYGNRLIIKPEEVKTTGLLERPDDLKEKPMIGRVVTVGAGTPDKPMMAKVGDKVLYARGAGIPIPDGVVEGETGLLFLTEGTQTFALLSEN